MDYALPRERRYRLAERREGWGPRRGIGRVAPRGRCPGETGLRLTPISAITARRDWRREEQRDSREKVSRLGHLLRLFSDIALGGRTERGVNQIISGSRWGSCSSSPCWASLEVGILASPAQAPKFCPASWATATGASSR